MKLITQLAIQPTSFSHIRIVLSFSTGLLKDPGSDAWVNVLSSLDCKCSFEPQAIPRSKTWRSNTPNTPSTPDGPMVKTEEEKEVLVLVELEDFLKRLFSLSQSFVNSLSASQPDLNRALPLASLESSSTKTYSLAVLGLRASWQYMLAERRQPALSPGKQSPSSQPGPELARTREEILEALVVLQLWGNIEVPFLDTWQEFGQHVSALTKAIVKRQYKSGIKGRRTDRAYEECSKEDEKLLLSDLPVKSDISGKDRRVGPDLPCHIYLFMVSTDPDLVLDLSAQSDCGRTAQPPCFTCQGSAVAEPLLARQRCWEPGQGKQLILVAEQKPAHQ
ncbi:LOW QUALITY PROTEIN: putative crossover junction endonuclease EME2 [Pluvialis apricaria]